MLPTFVETASEEETVALGARVAEELRSGDVVLLIGELGAGKTTFVRGVAGGLGVTSDVTSPTFTLCQIYEGRLKVLHADLWRLERLNEVLDLALEEGLEDGGVLLVEWGEAAEPVFGKEALVVTMEAGSNLEERRVSFEARGESWNERVQVR